MTPAEAVRLIANLDLTDPTIYHAAENISEDTFRRAQAFLCAALEGGQDEQFRNTVRDGYRPPEDAHE